MRRVLWWEAGGPSPGGIAGRRAGVSPTVPVRGSPHSAGLGAEAGGPGHPNTARGATVMAAPRALGRPPGVYLTTVSWRTSDWSPAVSR